MKNFKNKAFLKKKHFKLKMFRNENEKMKFE